MTPTNTKRPQKLTKFRQRAICSIFRGIFVFFMGDFNMILKKTITTITKRWGERCMIKKGNYLLLTNETGYR